MYLSYILLLSNEKDEKSFYPKPKFFDIILYPALIIICKYILLIKGIKCIYYFSDNNYF